MIRQDQRFSTFTHPQRNRALTAQSGPRSLQPAVLFPFFASGQRCLNLLPDLLSPPPTTLSWLKEYS